MSPLVQPRKFLRASETKKDTPLQKSESKIRKNSDKKLSAKKGSNENNEVPPTFGANAS